MNRVRGALAALLFAGCAILLSGCWDIKDIDHRALPVAMGITQTDSGYKVILEIPHSGQIETRVVSGTGPTINDVVDRISSNMESRVDLLHLKVIMFDEKYAREGLKDSISSFMRSREISPKAMIAICDDDMDKFFKRLLNYTSTDGTVIYDFFDKNAGWNPEIAQAKIWEIFRSINSFTRDIAIPVIRAGKDTPIEIAGSAIIQKGKMVGRISTDETLLLNAMNGVSAQGKIEVMNHASVLIVSNSVSHHSSFRNGKPRLKSRITLKLSILETKGNPTTALIKEELEALLNHRFNHMFKKIQSDKADILGLGQYFRIRIPREKLENWRTDYFSEMEMDFKINAIIENEGNLKTIQ